MSLEPEKMSTSPDTHGEANMHVADYAEQTTSTLLPMLIIGLVLVVIGMIAAMMLS